MASDQLDINKLRRRLLKAAAGTPVIFTLPVGTNVAAASTACDDDANALNFQEFRPTPSTSDSNYNFSESNREETITTASSCGSTLGIDQVGSFNKINKIV